MAFTSSKVKHFPNAKNILILLTKMIKIIYKKIFKYSQNIPAAKII